MSTNAFPCPLPKLRRTTEFEICVKTVKLVKTYLSCLPEFCKSFNGSRLPVRLLIFVSICGWWGLHGYCRTTLPSRWRLEYHTQLFFNWSCCSNFRDERCSALSTFYKEHMRNSEVLYILVYLVSRLSYLWLGESVQSMPSVYNPSNTMQFSICSRYLIHPPASPTQRPVILLFVCF